MGTDFMKKTFFILMCLFVLLSAVVCSAEEYVDPILLTDPHPNVFSCKNDIFIELPARAVIGKSASARYTNNYFIEFKAEILFLLEEPWDGLDRTSFSLKYKNADGVETVYPLDYAISMMSNMKNSWFTFSESYEFADLRFTNLIFEVDSCDTNGWTFVFRPTERGSDAPYCEVSVPLVFQ